MRFRSALLTILLPVVLGIGCGGDGSSTPPPDLAVNVFLEGETLVPVSGGQICHVRGTVRNTGDLPVDVISRWEAYDGEDRILGHTRLIVENIQPGTTQTFEASGFVSSSRLIPCSEIVRFERIETTVRRA